MRTPTAQHSFSVTALLIGSALLPANLYATALPIVDGGLFEIGNTTGLLGAVTDVPFCLNWGGNTTCSGATHSMDISGSSGLFQVGTGTIKDFSTGSVTDFETSPGGPLVGFQTVHFDLMSIPANTGATVGNCTSNAPLNSCTPSGSGFTFTEDITGNQVSITFAVLMNAYTGTSASGSTPYQGLFTMQQSGILKGSGACSGLSAKITNILTCEAAGGTIASTWSATESPVGEGTPGGSAPEPAVAFLIGGGLMALGLRNRLRF